MKIYSGGIENWKTTVDWPYPYSVNVLNIVDHSIYASITTGVPTELNAQQVVSLLNVDITIISSYNGGLLTNIIPISFVCSSSNDPNVEGFYGSIDNTWPVPPTPFSPASVFPDNRYWSGCANCCDPTVVGDDGNFGEMCPFVTGTLPQGFPFWRMDPADICNFSYDVTWALSTGCEGGPSS